MFCQRDCFAESCSFIPTSSETSEIADDRVHAAGSACFQAVIFWYYSKYIAVEPPRLEPWKSGSERWGPYGIPGRQSPKIERLQATYDRSARTRSGVRHALTDEGGSNGAYRDRLHFGTPFGSDQCSLDSLSDRQPWFGVRKMCACQREATTGCRCLGTFFWRTKVGEALTPVVAKHPRNCTDYLVQTACYRSFSSA
ncbi:hypothetical protein L209DRAFT_85029 [Thermothelomyces heterothallicus CBS 203.75]